MDGTVSAPPPYGGNTELCKTLSPDEVEETFFFPGPMSVRDLPARKAREQWAKAKDMCLDCPFYLACREVSLGENYGVWGGRDQYDRYLERRQLAHRLAKMSAEERAALAARLYATHESVAALARRTGYTEPTIKVLLCEHRAANPEPEKRRIGVLSDQERALLVSMSAKGSTMRYMTTALGRSVELIRAELALLPARTTKPTWPAAPPPHEAWVWQHGVARSATYIGQTADGEWIYMMLRGKRSPTRRWFAAEHVQMHKQVCVQILEWTGRPQRERIA